MLLGYERLKRVDLIESGVEPMSALADDDPLAQLGGGADLMCGHVPFRHDLGTSDVLGARPQRRSPVESLIFTGNGFAPLLTAMRWGRDGDGGHRERRSGLGRPLLRA